MTEQIISQVAQKTGLPLNAVKNTILLLQDGATIPFISRYRKELTGSLDEVQVALIQQELNYFLELEKRKTTILKTIEEQGQLTAELESRIKDTYDANLLEDLYLPFKPKKRTRATMAREKGLEPLAKLMMGQFEWYIEQKAKQFVNEDVAGVEEALAGARDIVAEWISENRRVRDTVRYLFRKGATISSRLVKAKEADAQKYRDYFDWQEPLNRCPSHRYLAMRRAEKEGFLKVSLDIDATQAQHKLEQILLRGNTSCREQMQLAIKDSYKRLVAPSIETEFLQAWKQKADKEAIDVFAENLRQLLLAPPLGQKRVLAVDPGFRTGCKIVCLDETGNLLRNETIYPHPPQKQVRESAQVMEKLVQEFQIEAIAVGNGTAGRETEQFIKYLRFDHEVQVFSVNEDGASVYSASKTGRDEFPDHDVTVRGAVSIGRRLMDPLAELVKIEPKSIGVGQYQHDVDQKLLHENLDTVVELCVNRVGVNLNTASQHLLTYVSGLGPQLAKNIVEYRKDHGSFTTRKALMDVPRMGAKSFEQAAGFLRIPDGTDPLDKTAVHPESYGIVKQMAKRLNAKVSDLIESENLRKQIQLEEYISDKVGLPTLKDILSELEKPGRDPREKVSVLEFDENIKTIEDLKPGMIVPGSITNITKFGAFVNLGIKENGLIHVSQLADKYIDDPAKVVKINQQVKVKVLEVDLVRKRIQLSLKAAR